MGAHGAIEVAKTVMEVADMAWTAMEISHNHHHHNQIHQEDKESSSDTDNDKAVCEVERELRSENRRLRILLEQNLKLLQNLSESPELLQDCPPDLHSRLVSAVNSKDFFTQLESLDQAEFPFKKATEEDADSAEILVNVDQKEPSWWVWVPDEMVPRNSEERSGIDHDNYLVITEDHVVDGVANFMAKCILSNPKAKNMKPEELQKCLAKAVEGVSKLERMVDIWEAGKMFYTLSSWGIALFGVYKTRAVWRAAAKGVRATGKLVLKAI